MCLSNKYQILQQLVDKVNVQDCWLHVKSI